MDSRVFDVLHDAADHHPLAIRDRVHVSLERVLQKAVDQYRLVFGDAGSSLEVLGQ